MASATNKRRLFLLLLYHLIEQHQLLRHVVLLLRLLTAVRLPLTPVSHRHLWHEGQSGTELLEQAAHALDAVVHVQIAAVQPHGKVREVGGRVAGVGNLR